MTPDNPQLLDQFALAMIIADADSLGILAMSPSASQLSGYSGAEACTLALGQLFPHMDADDLRRRVKQCSDPLGFSQQIAGRLFAHKDGSRRTVDIQLRGTRHSDRDALAVLVLDATDRQLAQDQLYYVLRAAQLGYWDWDLARETFEVDERWLDMYGYTRSELGGMPGGALDLIHPDDVQRIRDSFMQQVLYEDNFTLEFRALHKDGRTIHVRSCAAVVSRDLRSGSPLRVCGTSEDITAQTEARKQLRDQQELHASLLNNTEDVICHFDREHRHTYVNPAIANIWNIAPEQFIGRTRKELGFAPELCRIWDESIDHVFRTGQAHRDISTYESSHGPLRVYWYAFPGLIENGEVKTVFTVSRDISDYARTEEELRKMQKLNSLGILAGGIAHDFNNILTALFGNIALARSYLPGDHASQSSLDLAERAFHRATHLTSQLLTFAKGGDPVKQDVSIASFIEEIVKFDLTGSNVKLVFTAAPSLWKARVDKGQIAQVFSNLATNANQAMPNGGHLYVNIENCTLTAAAVPGLAAGDYLRCIVRDEGVGIRAADIDKIFDPYFSTRREGSGLGLATVYSIVTKHGGRILVNSRPGQGATFTLYLPASDSVEVPAATVPQAVQTRARDNSRILIMDDEKMICELGATFLTSKGYAVATAFDGKQAIALYADALQRGEPYDCLLMDLTIPGGMSGKDALTEILKLDPQARAIVSSGYAADPVMANYEEHGFKGCISKPFFIAALLEEIRRVLGETSTAR